MSKLNRSKRHTRETHEGAPAKHVNSEQTLRRSVMACMLWENQFYEDGQSIAKRISSTIPKVDPEAVAAIAIEAREKMKLRHVPLLIVREMARLEKHKGLVAETLSRVIQRADELTEFLAIYWKDGRVPLSAQVKKGLATAFLKFDAYQLAKYDRPGSIRLRDVLFLCHAKPENSDQEKLWKQLVDGTLPVPDTWEVTLSSGGDKKEHWERLLTEKKLGAMALLKNLRNMNDARVDEELIFKRLNDVRVDRVLPFRFISAARYAPQWEDKIEPAMLKAINSQAKLTGHTVLLVDVSGSMDSTVSERSNISRLDAACGVAMLLREICERVNILTFSMKLVRIPPRHGFALRDAIVTSQEHSGTPLGLAVQSIYEDVTINHNASKFAGYGFHDVDFQGQGLHPDRLIVITDEQSAGSVPDPIGEGYMINVASYENGVGYGPWTHIDGWSEAVVDYIRDTEIELN